MAHLGQDNIFMKILTNRQLCFLVNYTIQFGQMESSECRKGFQRSDFYWKFILMLFMVLSFGGFSMFFYGFLAPIISLPWPSLMLQNDFLNNLLSPLVFFMLPWFIIHYYLVLWKNKYLIFLPKYKYRNGRLFLNFFLCLIFIPLALLVIAVVVAKIIAN